MGNSWRSLHPVDHRVSSESLRRQRPKLRRLHDRMGEQRSVPDLHPRRRLLHLLPPAARLHRYLLSDDRHPSMAQKRPRHLRVTCRAQHSPFKDADPTDAGRRLCRIRTLLVASLLH